jgi:hypothetical protein
MSTLMIVFDDGEKREYQMKSTEARDIYNKCMTLGGRVLEFDHNGSRVNIDKKSIQLIRVIHNS